MKNKDGFTLIEIIVVIVIIGIMAGVAVPYMLNLLRSGQEAQVKGFLGAFHSAIVISHSESMLENRQQINYPPSIDGSIFHDGNVPKNILVNDDVGVICSAPTFTGTLDINLLADLGDDGSAAGVSCSPSIVGIPSWLYINGDVYPTFPDETYVLADYLIQDKNY